MPSGINAELATYITACSSMIYAVIAGVSLLLLLRQIRDARRFGAAPALYALLKELDVHLAAIQRLRDTNADESATRETTIRCLEFYERIEHLRQAGVIQVAVLRRAFGSVLTAHLDDPRFVAIVQQAPRQYEEVMSLATAVGSRPECRLRRIGI